MNWAQGQPLQNGKYVIEKRLGTGGFGITYKARHTILNYDVVIKTPNEDVKSDPDYAKYVDRFIREGRMVAQLSNDPHPHIVRISDLFLEGDTHCLVMDFIPGESLWHLVGRRGALPETEAVEYIRQIGSALSVVHQNKLVHLDVTPPNIMVRNNGNAVLIDFGIAADMSPPSTLSRTFGNQAFAPYELRKGKRQPTVDIYCLAASLYYAVTGQCPTKSFDRKYEGIELKAPKQLVPSISDGLNQAILQGMALEAQDRPQSVQEWLQLLPQQPIDDLSSEKSLDYTKLRDLLARGKWKEADEETLAVMLKVAALETDGNLTVEDIKKFPCTDLRTIDSLWVKYSEGRFGFSVHKRIWESVGGTPDADYKTYCRFSDRVG
jgi:serine/threonine-protein kinase